MLILIDNGHGCDTPGKCSPDGRLREWDFTRRVGCELKNLLNNQGIDAHLITPENLDIPLPVRIARANSLSQTNPCLLISIHVNAAWNCGWNQARGFSAFITPSASSRSLKLAQQFTATFRAAGLEGNRRPGAQDCYRGNFAILRCTRCPAVLTENLFMDNRQDLEFLLSPDSVSRIATLHTQAIISYIKAYE